MYEEIYNSEDILLDNILSDTPDTDISSLSVAEDSAQIVADFDSMTNTSVIVMLLGMIVFFLFLSRLEMRN